MADLRLLRARNALADGFARDGEGLAHALVSGLLDVPGWVARFLSLLSHGITAGFLLGRDRRVLDARGAGIVDGLIRGQFGYAQGFAADVIAAQAAGTLSAPVVANRSGLYAGGAIIHPCEVGRAERWGVALDHYPGDGSSECKGNCRCSLDFQDDGAIVRVYWRAHDDGRVCETCAQREADWNPLVLTQRGAA